MRLFPLAAIVTGAALAGRAASTPVHASPPSAPLAAPPFSWPGVYDLRGDGFPEGARRAVLTIEQGDSALRVRIEGPPGRLLNQHFAADTAHLVWDLADGGLMYVELLGRGDSVAGRWEVGTARGPIQGARRR